MLSNSAEAVKLELFSNTLKRPIKEIETEIHHQVKKQRIKIEKNLDEESPLDERENTKKKSKKAIDFDSEEDDITPSNGDDKHNQSANQKNESGAESADGHTVTTNKIEKMDKNDIDSGIFTLFMLFT